MKVYKKKKSIKIYSGRVTDKVFGLSLRVILMLTREGRGIGLLDFFFFFFFFI